MGILPPHGPLEGWDNCVTSGFQANHFPIPQWMHMWQRVRKEVVWSGMALAPLIATVKTDKKKTIGRNNNRGK